MSEERFPKGWDEKRVKELISELDGRTEDEWTASDEAAASGGERRRRANRDHGADLALARDSADSGCGEEGLITLLTSYRMSD
jgi:hypothetical protein